MEEFICRFEVVYTDNNLCTVWGQVRANARAAGRPMSLQDAWIAATAIGLDGSLATNNRLDFEHVAGLRLFPL